MIEVILGTIIIILVSSVIYMLLEKVDYVNGWVGAIIYLMSYIALAYGIGKAVRTLIWG